MNTFKKKCMVFITALSSVLSATSQAELFTVGTMSWPIEHSNQIYVARQIESITTPTLAQQELLNDFALLGLTTNQVEKILTALSGTAYVNDLPAMELSSNLFIRRLYTQARPFLTRPICDRESVYMGWVELSGGSSFFKRNKNSPGLNIEDYEATVGAHTCLGFWTLGGAFSYEYDSKHYHYGAHGKSQSYSGALYGIYRPADYYVMVDLLGGYQTGKIDRTVRISFLGLEARGKPKAFDVDAYVEVGKDYAFRTLLIQPFFGLEGGYFNSKRISESGTTAINLNVHEKSYGIANSRLGVHLSSWDEKFGFEFGFDLSWQYRLISPETSRTVAFQTFGDNFKVRGVTIDRNSFDGAFSVSKKLCQWTLFVMAEGQVANTWSNYNVMGGVSVGW